MLRTGLLASRLERERVSRRESVHWDGVTQATTALVFRERAKRKQAE